MNHDLFIVGCLYRLIQTTIMIRFPLLKASRLFSGVKYLRDEDSLSQEEIDSILGNDLD